MAPILGYWDIRGFAQPIRFILAYTGTEYDEKRYKQVVTSMEPITVDRSEWLNDKPNLGLDFPNIPYYIDGDIKLSQTFAIMKYIAGKHDLVAKTEKEQLRINVLEGENDQFRYNWAMLCYDPNFDQLKDNYLKDRMIKLQEFSDFLGNNKWFAGDRLTYIDFLTYEVLDQQHFLQPKDMDNFENLKRFLKQFENLEPIAAYMKSSRYIKFPVFSPSAVYGGYVKK